ncbi:histidine triad nucleotide-binding protein [Sediminicurvatus halobius]|uniref:Histidine triad nucleotide-binding protein n=1 Tax=Sediminicurvatus halobius TaxID=2182432 RepID=A0A2U2MW17_9GAMM|nr:histidine triad nucleotide-binding protein [Spiribacter halobius]PWG61050.1 histidine triad nucleotide-binding protein [Spiribacter halobius]UEX76778.1 histidine triad nucleotide-binding protein [Spiribacter halobius]
MTEADCIFCRIAAGTAPADELYRDEAIIAFRDLHPQAPVHVLVVPREHIPSLLDLEPRHAEIVGRLHLVARSLAERLAVADRGYRTVFNCGNEAGQSVWHIHLHLLAGRPMGWPPWPATGG